MGEGKHMDLLKGGAWKAQKGEMISKSMKKKTLNIMQKILKIPLPLEKNATPKELTWLVG